MTTKQFVEKAIEGGWKNDMFPMLEILTNGKTPYANFEAVLLNPKAWEAVGKVEGWGDTGTICLYEYSDTKDFPKYPKEIQVAYFPVWKVKMHGMIDSLIGGKTIEDYLKTL